MGKKKENPSKSNIVFKVKGDATGNAVGDGAYVLAGNISNNIKQETAALEKTFSEIVSGVLARPASSNVDTLEIIDEVKRLCEEAKKGESADETTLKYRLRSIGRMAPDILDVIIASFASPLSGISTVLHKIALKVKKELE